ncbi:MAG: PEP-CTERM sorting domain-containing protein [Pirellulaceae bacterium]
MRLSTLSLALLAGLAIATSQVHAAIVNGGFETGDFSGWDVGILPGYDDGGRPYAIDPTGDGWIVSNVSPGSLSPINGYTAFNGFDGGVLDEFGRPVREGDLLFYLRQDFSFTGEVEAATLDFSFDIYGGPRGSEPRVFSVNILDGGSNVANLYTYSVASVDSNPLQTISLDIAPTLDALGAGTYTLSFEELIPQYYTGPGRFAIDDISLEIETAPVPEPSSLLAFAGLGMCFGAGSWWRRRRKPAA